MTSFIKNVQFDCIDVHKVLGAGSEIERGTRTPVAVFPFSPGLERLHDSSFDPRRA
jgi:hypothetical protein